MNKLFLPILIFLITAWGALKAQSHYDIAKDHVCLKCHASQIITFQNEVIGKEVKKLMNPLYILDTVAIKASVHGAFDCTDCHSFEYTTYPHEASLKLSPMATCLDCHGGDPTYSTYQFDRIDEEFQKSVHFEKIGENFSCGACHNQHTYHPTARNSANVREIVEYSNSMCLSCHNNMSRYQMMAGHDNPVIVQVHNWLPNQEVHFKNIRCIDCHTTITDTLMISHNINKKELAVKNCVECHNQNSLLKASLYKYSNLQARSEGSGFRTILANEAYIIGAQQFPLLRKLSNIILLLVFAGISVHFAFRKIKK